MHGWIWWWWMAGRISKFNVNNVVGGEDFKRNAADLQVFSFAEIEKATNKFAFVNKLGQGGYGPVYKVHIKASFIHEFNLYSWELESEYIYLRIRMILEGWKTAKTKMIFIGQRRVIEQADHTKCQIQLNCITMDSEVGWACWIFLSHSGCQQEGFHINEDVIPTLLINYGSFPYLINVCRPTLIVFLTIPKVHV